MHINLTSLQDNFISPFLIGSSPLANSSQPAGIDHGLISGLVIILFVSTTLQDVIAQVKVSWYALKYAANDFIQEVL